MPALARRWLLSPDDTVVDLSLHGGGKLFECSWLEVKTGKSLRLKPEAQAGPACGGWLVIGVR